MKKYLAIFAIIIIAASGVLAAPQLNDDKATCSPWLGKCQLTEQCCRHLLCLPYASKCVPMSGIPPIDDDRPIGPGPYPPTRRTFDLDDDIDIDLLEEEDKSE